MTMQNKKSSKLKYFVIFSIAMVVAYTAVCTTLTALTDKDFSSLYLGFLGVFGGEVMSCSLIKIFKLKEKDNNGME